jgi:hypothetical protein
VGGVSPGVHHPSRSKSVTVKPAKPRLRHKPHCVVCGANLRGDHCLGELVCDSHSRDGGDPRSAAPVTMNLSAEERLLLMLYRAAPAPLNVHRAFGCHSSDTNKAWFRDAVKRINGRLGPVRGTLHVGYKFATVRPGRGSR